MKEGDPLYVEGRLQYRVFHDEEGKERGVTEVVAGDVQFLGPRKGAPATEAIGTPQTANDEVSPDEFPF